MRRRDYSCFGLSFRYQLLVHLGLGHCSLMCHTIIEVRSKLGGHRWRRWRRRWRRWRTGTWGSWRWSRWSRLSFHQHFFQFSFLDELLVHPGLGHHGHLTNTIFTDWSWTSARLGGWRWWRWWRSCRRWRWRWRWRRD